MIDSKENIMEMLKMRYCDAVLCAQYENTLPDAEETAMYMGFHYVNTVFNEHVNKDEYDKLDDFIKNAPGSVNISIDIYKQSAFIDNELNDSKVLHIKSVLKKEDIKKLNEYNIDVFLMTLHAMMKESLYALLK